MLTSTTIRYMPETVNAYERNEGNTWQILFDLPGLQIFGNAMILRQQFGTRGKFDWKTQGFVSNVSIQISITIHPFGFAFPILTTTKTSLKWPNFVDELFPQC